MTVDVIAMTVDVIALCREQPDVAATLTALLAAGPQLRVRPIERGGLVQLCDDTGAPLVTVEGPSLVQVPGEVQRLLGIARSVPAGSASLLGSDRNPACWIRTDSPEANPFTQFRTVLQHFGSDTAPG
ncbi:MAG: hypothetical protein ACT4NY_24920 [Pseudonocardiales bacterium]